ncbi:MAG: lactate racemase domain-containing protein, partial [Gemmatimonadota bacterium]|nr:lactate racemase domain-containing protein [Gemmatimonadota bacterium]
MAATQIELPFGDSHLQVDVPSERLLGVVLPRAEQGGDGAERTLVRDALARPVGTPTLRSLVRPGQQVVIIVSDMTRPCPTDRLLPLVLEELAAASVPDADVTVIVALGLHRAQTAAELAALVGSAVYDRVRVVNHD